MKRIFVIVGLLILALLIAIPVLSVSADDGTPPHKIGDIKVEKGGYEARFVGMTADNKKELWQVDFSAPKYLPTDLSTPIGCYWSFDVNKGEWVSGANLFSASVKGTKVTATNNGQKLSWQPDITIGTKKLASKDTPTLLTQDPINRNYFGNTLQWDYGNGITRNLRIIEGMLIEYYTISVLPTDDILITPHITKDLGFVWTRPSVAWDADFKLVSLAEDKDGVLTLLAADAAKVKLPITIDPTTTFTTSASDGNVYGSGASYTTLWSASTGSVDSSSTAIYIGQSLVSNYNIWRGFVYFDTSAIPDGATISSATLKLAGYADDSATDFYITIQNGQPTYPSDPLVATDYDKTYYSGNGGSLTTVGFSTTGYNNITLNATGLGWINKTGTTKLCLRSDREIAGTTPTGNECVRVSSYEYGTSWRPSLVVTYAASAAPTMTTDAASNIAQTTARLNSTVVDDKGGNVTVRFGWGTTSQATINAYTYQGNVSGTYNTGNHPYLDISSLTLSTLYYFRVEGTNDAGATLGSELTFTTESGVGSPSNLRAYSSTTSISCTWTKGTGSTNSIVRYKVGSYPTTYTDGQSGYSGTSASCAISGLTTGTTYYISVWGESGGTYSSGHSDAMATTSAAGAAGENFSAPNQPPGWAQEPNPTALSALEPFYSIVNNAFGAVSIPVATGWIIITIFGCVFIAGLIFAFTHQFVGALIALMFTMGIGIMLQLLPSWMLFFELLMGLGLWSMKGGAASE